MNGKITLSRYANSRDEECPIHIKMEDEKSGAQFLDISMSLENFALMLTNLGFIDCQFELRGLDVVGKQREHKIVNVPLPKGMFLPSTAEASELIKPFETDGWIGRVDDVTNHHNRSYDNNSVKVSFVRWVDDKSDIL